jgi:hypothetical protein
MQRQNLGRNIKKSMELMMKCLLDKSLYVPHKIQCPSLKSFLNQVKLNTFEFQSFMLTLC